MLLSGRLLKRVRTPDAIRQFFSRSNEKKEPISGLFGNDLLKSPAGFRQLNEVVRANCDVIVSQIERGRDDRTTVQLFDDLSNEICKAADLVECARQLHCDEQFNEAAETSARDYCQLVESLNTYTVLYEKLKASKKVEAARLDAVDQRTIDLFLDDFEQSGVHLPADKREEFVRLSGEIFDAGAKFQWGCDRDVTVSRTEQRQFALPSTTLSSPVSFSTSGDQRKFVHNAYYRHDDGQEALLRRLVSSRDDLARLTGFDSFAHRAQYNTLLGTYENARDFLHGVIETCRPAAERELAVLVDVKAQCDSNATTVGEWDINYLTHLYKERAFGSHHYDIARKYLSLGGLVTGFGSLVEKLYSIRLEEQIPQSGELWDGTVVKMMAVDSKNNVLGHIYLDVDRRSTKAVGDCHYTVRCSKQLSDGSWQTPIVVLSLSLSDVIQKDWRSVTLSVHSAENLFHELGHAMHSMLGRTKYQHVAGTRCPQDFSEIPSNLMEYFFNDITVMQTVLRDSTGRSIPVEHAASLISSRFAFSSLETVQQAAYALFDLELHGSEARRVSSGRLTSTDLFHSIATSALPHLQRDAKGAFQHRFHHLVQYGAKYYSYLVARSAASLIWNSEFRHLPFNSSAGARWAEVQSHGGGLPPSILLRSILGYSPTADHLISALRQETTQVANLGAVNV